MDRKKNIFFDGGGSSSRQGVLRGVGFSACDDHVLAAEWRDALGRILRWLGPLAHNMIKWQSERRRKKDDWRRHFKEKMSQEEAHHHRKSWIRDWR